MTEVLQFGGRTCALQLLVSLENLRLKLKIVLQHQHLLVVHLEITEFLFLLQLLLLLFEQDCLFQAATLLLAGFCVQLHQHLACFHGISLFDKNLISDTPHRHLNVLNRTDRFELTGSHNNLFGASQRQPGHTEDSRTDQGPSHRLHPETSLLQDRFVVGDQIGRVRIWSRSVIPPEWIQLHDQVLSCWRYKA